MAKPSVAGASIASLALLLLALPTLAAVAWVDGARAAQYPITGNLRSQIGAGLPVPIALAPVPVGKVIATPSAVVIQASTGPDPRKITIPPGIFHHPGTPPGFLPLYGANNNVWQILTEVSVTLPATPIIPGGALLNVLQQSGRTGPPNVTWCPGSPLPNVTYNPGCTRPKAAPLTNIPGRIRYRKTENQFGGPISSWVGGLVDLALRVTGAGPPCDYAITTCQAYFALGSPLQSGVIGGPFGRQSTTTGPAPSPGRFNIVATEGGTITYMTPTGIGPGRGNPAHSWAGPWTTGQIINSAWTYGPPSGIEIFTLTGTDMRVNGVGVIHLVAGALSNRGVSGPNANRGWLNITVPEPAAVASAAGALLLLLGCHSLVRRRSR